MLPAMRKRYALAILIVVVAGIASRSIATGLILFDKYLGDALYAVMLYLGLGLLWPEQSIVKRSLAAMALVGAIELFQTSGIPQSISDHPSLILRLLAIALGTQFSWLDMLAYAVGIGAAAFWQGARKRPLVS